MTAESRFYTEPTRYGVMRSTDETARLLGNRVLLLRKEPDSIRTGGDKLIIPDKFNTGSYTFWVVAVGPGEWVYFKNRGKTRKLWIQPEVKRGDLVCSRHWWRSSQYPGWHQPVYLDDVEGEGRTVVDARFVEYIITQ